MSGKTICISGLLFVLFAGSSILNALTYSLHATGGYTSLASSYQERRLPQAGDNILVTGPMQWDAPLPDGVHDIVLNSATASWQIAPYALNLRINFGSTGIDAVGAACGGVAGTPGNCATMYGFTVIRAASPCLDLTTPAGSSPTVLSTVDGVSPIYIRYQPTAGCASLTMKNVIINNLGGDSSCGEGYSGIYFYPAGTAINAKVDVENVQVLHYYRLFYGGPAWTDSTSIFKWFAVSSFNGRAHTYGAITMATSRAFHTTQVYDDTDSQPTIDGYFFYTFPVGSNIDIQRPFVAGSQQFKRGAYFNLGTTTGSGGNTIRDAFCLNYPGSTGSESCVYDTGSSQFGTSVFGMVSIGNYETLALRPLMGTGSYQGAAPEWTNFWLSEDASVAVDQGVVFTGGGIPHAHHGVVVVTGPRNGQYQIGVFAYAGAQPTWDHLTVVGINAHSGTSSLGMQLGESGYTIHNGHSHSNIVMGFDRGILDCNSKTNCPGTTYVIDSDVGAGVHHNDVWDATSGNAYNYNGGLGFENSALTAHPATVYGDLAVNPYFADTSRTPFTFDRDELNGDGSGSALISVTSSRWQLPVASLNPAKAALGYLLQGFTPMTGNAVCNDGYQGTQMGAVACQ